MHSAPTAAYHHPFTNFSHCCHIVITFWTTVNTTLLQRLWTVTKFHQYANVELNVFQYLRRVMTSWRPRYLAKYDITKKKHEILGSHGGFADRFRLKCHAVCSGKQLMRHFLHCLTLTMKALRYSKRLFVATYIHGVTFPNDLNLQKGPFVSQGKFRL
jgi:hypothetical protein